MKPLTKGAYYAKSEKETGAVKLWHDCAKYKKRDIARVKLEKMEESADTATYKCRICGFEYKLDKNLNLK